MQNRIDAVVTIEPLAYPDRVRCVLRLVEGGETTDRYFSTPVENWSATKARFFFTPEDVQAAQRELEEERVCRLGRTLIQVEEEDLSIYDPPGL